MYFEHVILSRDTVRFIKIPFSLYCFFLKIRKGTAWYLLHWCCACASLESRPIKIRPGTSKFIVDGSEVSLRNMSYVPPATLLIVLTRLPCSATQWYICRVFSAIIMPRCACASEVYGSVFVCLSVCVSVCVDCSRINEVQVRVSIGFLSCFLGF